MSKHFYSVYLLPPWAPLVIDRLHDTMVQALHTSGGSRPCLLCKARCGPDNEYVAVYVVLTDHNQNNELTLICTSCAEKHEDLETLIFKRIKLDRLPDAEVVHVHTAAGHA